MDVGVGPCGIGMRNREVRRTPVAGGIYSTEPRRAADGRTPTTILADDLDIDYPR
jgi:hypothetical protein